MHVFTTFLGGDFDTTKVYTLYIYSGANLEFQERGLGGACIQKYLVVQKLLCYKLLSSYFFPLTANGFRQ